MTKGRGRKTSALLLLPAKSRVAFVAARLPDPSHARSLCQLEQAVLRAEAAHLSFMDVDPSLPADATVIARAGGRAAMVVLHGGLANLLAAIESGSEALPPLSAQENVVLVAPGIAGLARPAKPCEVAAWHVLQHPQRLGDLRYQGHGTAIAALWAVGALTANAS